MPWGKLGTIWSEIGLDWNPLAQGVARSKSLMDEADRALTTKAKSISKTLTDVGKTMSLQITAPLSLVGGMAVKTALDFETSMANVWTIVDAGKDTIKAMADEVEALSGELPQTAKQLADGLYQVISAAIPAEKSMGVLEVSARAAAAGLSDTFTAVDAVTSVLNAYGKAAEEAGIVSDVMFKTVERGKVTFPELAQNLGDVVSTAATAGVSFEEVSAAIATLTKVGVRAPEAVTAINQALLTLIDPSDEAAKLAKQLGIEFSAATLASKGFYAVLQDVSQATGGNIEQLSALFPNVRALKGVLGLVRQDMELFRDDLDAMQSAAGATGAAFEKQASTGAHSLQLFKNQVSNLARSVGDELIPMLTAGIEKVQPYVDMFRNLPEPVKETIVQFGALAAMAGPVCLALGGIVGMLSGPAGIVVGAVAAVGAIVGLGRYLDDVSGRAERAGKAAEEHADSLRDERARAQELVEEIQGLTNEKEALRRKTSLTRDEEERLAKVQGEIKALSNGLASIIPTVAAAYDDEGNAVIDLNKALGELVRLRQQEYAERAKAAESYVVAARARVEEAEEALKRLDEAREAYLRGGEAQDPWTEAYLANFRQMVGAEAALTEENTARLNESYNAQKRKLITELETARRDLSTMTQRYRAVGMTAATGRELGTAPTGADRTTAPPPVATLQTTTAPAEPSAWKLWLENIRKLSEESYSVLKKAFEDIARNLESGDIVLRTEAEERMSAILSFLSDAVVEYGGDWEGKIAPALSQYIKRGYKTAADVVKEEAQRFQKVLDEAQNRLTLIRTGMIAPDSLAAFKIVDAESVATYLKDKAEEIAKLVETNRKYLDAVLEGKAIPRSWVEVKLWDEATLQEGIEAGKKVLKDELDKEALAIASIIALARTRLEAVMKGEAAGEVSWADLKLWDYATAQEGLEAGQNVLKEQADKEAAKIDRIITQARLRVEAVMEGKATGEVPWPDLKMWDYATAEEGLEAGKRVVANLTEKKQAELDRRVKLARQETEAVLEGKAAPTSWPLLKLWDEATLQEGIEAGKEAVKKIVEDELKELERALVLARQKTEAVMTGKAALGPEDLGLLKMLDEAAIQEGIEAGRRAVEQLEQYERDLFEFRKRTGQVTFEEEIQRLQDMARIDGATKEERLKQAQTYHDTVSGLIAGATEEQLAALERTLEANLATYQAMGEQAQEKTLAVLAALDALHQGRVESQRRAITECYGLERNLTEWEKQEIMKRLQAELVALDASTAANRARAEAVKETITELSATMPTLEQMTASWGQTLIDGLSRAIAYGEDLGDLFTGLLRQIAEWFLKYKVFMPLLGPLFGGGMAALAIPGIGAGWGPLAPIPFMHLGGLVEAAQPPSMDRLVRAHSGLAPDEVPVIAQTGERILSRQQNAAFERLLAEPRQVQVEMHIHAVDAASFASLAQRNPEAITSVVIRNIQSNGEIRRVLMGR